MRFLVLPLIILNLLGSLSSLTDYQSEYLANGCEENFKFFKVFTININSNEAEAELRIYRDTSGKDFDEVKIFCEAQIFLAKVCFSFFIISIVIFIIVVIIVIGCCSCIMFC